MGHARIVVTTEVFEVNDIFGNYIEVVLEYGNIESGVLDEDGGSVPCYFIIKEKFY